MRQVRLPGHVTLHERSVDALGHPGPAGGVDVGDHHPGALRREAGECPPDPTGAARDDRNLTIQSSHGGRGYAERQTSVSWVGRLAVVSPVARNQATWSISTYQRCH